MTATTAVVAEPVKSEAPTRRSAQQMAEEEGLTFAGTPGPGYSEGGDVYEPVPAPEEPGSAFVDRGVILRDSAAAG